MTKKFFTGIVGLLLIGFLVTPGFGQSIDDILNKWIETSGGRSVIEATKDMTMTGTIEISQQGLEGTLTIYKKEPNKRRTDVEIMGFLITEAYDGEDAWYLNPQSGAIEDMNEDQAAQTKRQAMPVVSILDPKKFGISYALKEKEQIEGKDYFVVEQSYEDGFSVILYIDTETYLPYKSIATISSPVGEVEVEQYTSDYKKIEGRMIPHTIVAYQDGAEYTNITITEVKYNTGLEDSLFQRDN